MDTQSTVYRKLLINLLFAKIVTLLASHSDDESDRTNQMVLLYPLETIFQTYLSAQISVPPFTVCPYEAQALCDNLRKTA